MENYFQPNEYLIKSTTINDVNIDSSNLDNEICRTDSTNKWVTYLNKYLSQNKYLIKNIDMSNTDIIFDSTKDYLDDPARRSLKIEIDTMIKSVSIIETLSNNDYDKLFAENIVFLDLVSCSAANTLVESIVRSTPLVVNRIQPVVEVLGEDYPLFYDKLEDIDKLLTMENIKKAHCHIKHLDKSDLRIDTMINKIREGQIYRNI
jgi:hypothetical protein